MHPDNVIDRRAAALAADWRVLDLDDLLALDLPPSLPLLPPVLATRRTTLLRGPAGAGESVLALSLAHAVASGGGLLGWAAPARAGVLYVDAALPLGALQARVALLDRAGPAASPGLLRLLAADAQGAAFVDLGGEVGRAALERVLADGADMLVLDDLAALVPGARAERWQSFVAWLMGLRRRGLALLLVDTWRRRRRGAWLAGLADTVIDLSHPADWHPEDGARVVVRPAARFSAGPALRAFEARLQPEASAPWTRLEALDADALQVWRLTAQGFTIRKIAAMLHIPSTTVHRLLTRARRLDPALREDMLAGDGTSGTSGTAGTDGTGGTPGTA